MEYVISTRTFQIGIFTRDTSKAAVDAVLQHTGACQWKRWQAAWSRFSKLHHRLAIGQRIAYHGVQMFQVVDWRP